MKKVILILVLIFSLLSQSVSVIQAAEDGRIYLDLGFDNGELVKEKTGWALNTPKIKEIDGYSAAWMTNESGGSAYYTFEMKNMSLKGDLVIETRVKQSTSNVLLVKAFMNSGGSLGYVHLMSRYIDPSLGAVWVNADKTSEILGNYSTDVNADEPDMQNGWDTIYIHVNTETGKYRTYLNDSSSFTEGSFAGNGDNFLHSLRFGVMNAAASDPTPSVYVDYIKIYSADLLNVPDTFERKISAEANFDTIDIGTNLRRTLFGYVTDDNTLAEVAADPADGDNKCARLYAKQGAPFAARFMASALFGQKAILEFSAYLPQNLDADLFTITTNSSSLVSTNNAAGKTLSYGSTICEADLSEWNDFRYEIDLTSSADNVLCYINGRLAAKKTVLGNRLIGIKFGIPSGSPQGLYLDNIRFYTDDELCKISASKQSGKVGYNDIITLTPSDSSAVVYYTTDGTSPDENSAVYSDGIKVDANNLIIKAVGYIDGVPGRVYTFGSYTLDSIEGIIITQIKLTDEKVAAGSSISADFNLLNTAEEREAACILGVYDEGKLIGCKEEKVSLKKGLNSAKVSFTAPEYSYKAPEIRAFVWDSMESGRIYCEYITDSDEGEGTPAAVGADGDVPTVENVKCSINSTDAIVTVSGAVRNPVKNQDISILVSSENEGSVCALTQSYVDGDGAFKVSVPLRKDIKGGFYKVCIGGRRIDERVCGSVYYVDDAERAAGVLKINAQSKDTMIDTIEELYENSVLDIDIENEIYAANKSAIGDILYYTKEKKAFSFIEEITHAFDKAAAMYEVLNSDGKYFEAVLKNKEVFDFMKDDKYSFDEKYDFVKGNAAFSAQLKELPADIYAFEDAYKTAVALTALNSSERSEIAKTLSDYNDILKLELDGDYKSVSEYEVAKALYNMNFKDISAVKAAFDKRVAELKSETKKQPTGGGGGGGGRDTGYKNNSIIGGSAAAITPVTPVKKEDKFKDVSSKHWAYEPIEQLADKGIVKGFEDNTFKPDKGVTRAEFVTMLMSAFGFDNAEAEEVFDDVKKTDWYFKYVMAAFDKGIVSGDGNNFNPSSFISREDMAVIVYRLLSKDEADGELSFTDADLISDYAKKAVAYISSIGVISGFEDGSFKPSDTLTRAQSARIIYTIINE